MSKITDARYDAFKKNLESVNGSCYRSSKADLGKALAEILQKADVKDICLAESPLLKEAGAVDALKTAGIKVYTDHIRLHVETVKGGVSENQYGIAELGTLVQGHDGIDERIVATASAFYVGVVKGSTIVETYDDMFDTLCALPELPNFVGFMTGPSRTADIECVTTVGVHGPLELTAVVIDDE